MAVWRFTGNPENWLTALHLNKWALNEHGNNPNLWKNNIGYGDTVVFHSTTSSDFPINPPSSIIGLGYVELPFFRKNEFWWIQEIKDQGNYWPLVVPFKEMYTLSDISEIDLTKNVNEKTDEQVVREINLLLKDAIPLSKMNDEAKRRDPDVPYFPVNGSASGMNPIYENLILQNSNDLFTYTAEFGDESQLEVRHKETVDQVLNEKPFEVVLEEAREYKSQSDEQYRVKKSPQKIRKENQIQKRRVAKIENYTCQICGYYYCHKREDGKSIWIYEVDHIRDKALGGTEELSNLWVLCPNCHAKKTKGVITVDLGAKKVFENDKEIPLHCDNHLFVS